MNKQPEGMTQPRQSQGDYCVIPEGGNDGNTDICSYTSVTGKVYRIRNNFRMT